MRDGKSIFFISFNTNQLTMISEAGHRSTILILGSSSSSLSSNCCFLSFS